MDADGLPLVGAGIDCTTVEAIEKKRLVAFLNHYVIHTVKFLNKFSCVCEEKMASVANRISRLEATLSVLEDKLSSIPGLENVGLPATSTAAAGGGTLAAPAAPPLPPGASVPPPAAATGPQQSSLPPPPPPEPVQERPTSNLPKVSEDPRFIKYFKMINMGVPMTAVKLKMKTEGFDSELLDTPDAPAPPTAAGDGTDGSSLGSSAEESDDSD